MPGNSFGQLFRITTFGESHGAGIGVVIDGCPAGLEIDTEAVQQELNRRRPGQSEITSPRNEKDEVEFLSGLFEGKSTGAPLAMFIRNQDQRPGDYRHLQEGWRPGHADFTYDQKYGFRDHRGGGRSSARETAARVMAGAVAKQLLAKQHIHIAAYVSSVADIHVQAPYTSLDLSTTESTMVRCPEADTAARMIQLIEKVRDEGDTVGGIITCVAFGAPAGLGEPVFHKLQADLAGAMLSINAAKGFEIGSGFKGTEMRGSQHNDQFAAEVDPAGHPRFRTLTNHSGGIQGGISNGADIVFRVAFKPVSTLLQTQESVDKEGKTVNLEGKGRHDPCVLPRAVPIVEAMCALVLTDHLLLNRNARV
ncbi:MAG: chorismate synthase [Bacteroidia bacterium]|nr:chorismate synthase [Bacteroidia bacterium]